jgi:ABC-2 type transport system permease protein
MIKQPNPLPGVVAQLSGSFLLAAVSLRRAVRWRQTAIALMLLAFAAVAALAWSLHRPPTSQDVLQVIILPLYVSFLLPIFCLCFAAPSIAADREEQTLIYLLATGLPRPLVFVSKYAAALILSIIWTVGALGLLCSLSGPAGRALFAPLCPAVCWTAAAYVGLFHLFSVLWRRATIIALIYALFLETFVGNMPGIVKRVSISFYTQCLILDAASQLGIDPGKLRETSLFLPISAGDAWSILWILAVLLFVSGAALFSRLEYA